jgi:hypothetical protein
LGFNESLLFVYSADIALDLHHICKEFKMGLSPACILREDFLFDFIMNLFHSINNAFRILFSVFLCRLMRALHHRIASLFLFDGFGLGKFVIFYAGV